MPTLEVKCPSGLVGTVRGWKTKEANILANRKEARAGTSFDKVLANCWMSTAEVGPYAEASNGRMDWSKVLVCDRFWALLMMRAATYGDEYVFRVPCEDRERCRARIEWECNLSELPFLELPKESRDKIAAGDNSFETELERGDYAGKLVQFKLVDGTAERGNADRRKGQDARLIVTALASRIVGVDGIELEALSDPDATKAQKRKADDRLIAFLDEMELGDLVALLRQFDEVDGGVETLIEIECDACGLTQDVELPLGKDFFLPKLRGSRRATA